MPGFVHPSYLRSSLILLTTIASLGLAQQTSSTRLNVAADSATVRQLNSQNFPNYTSLATLDTLLSLPANADKKSLTVSRTVQNESTSGSGAESSRGDYLSSQAINADVVIVGRPLSHTSAITADRCFAFTDYVVQVDDIEKDDTHSMKAGDHVVISRAGGIVNINGVTVHAVDPNFPQFSSTRRYIFFLRALPNSTAFKVTARDVFSLEGDHVRAGLSTLPSLNKSESEFRGDVREAVRRAVPR